MKAILAALIALPLLCSGAATAQPAKDPAPTPATKQEFESFIQTFRGALKANDAAAVAAMTLLPYMNDKSISTAEQFRSKVYTRYFTPKTRTCLQRSKTVYSRDDYKNDSFFIFCGDDIFVFTKSPTGFQFTDISVND